MIHFKRLSPAFFLFAIILFLSFPSSPLAQTCTDADGDGYGLNGDASCPAPGVDCDDDDPNVYPDAPRICDGKDSDCDGFDDFFTDKDMDGDGSTMCAHWQTGLKDCDDSNPVMYPGNVEGPFGDPTCSDGFDNDCDFRKDGSDNGCSVNCLDSDGDGYGNPGNVTCPNGNALDCNDSNDLINPGATDTNCNGVDDNCSGTADDGYVVTGTNCGVGECASTGTLSCSGGVESDSCVEGLPAKEGALGHPTCSDTLDNDCDGATDGTDVGCQSSCLDDDGDGYGHYGDASCPNAGVDCNDDNAAINPGATDDVCDGVDANCSGTPDDEYTPPVTNCGVGECVTTGLLICNAGVPEDNCAPLAPGTEGPFGDPTCSDTLDNDCDGVVDAPDNDCNPLDQDNDGDGFCEIGPCQNPSNLGGDCDDTDSVTYPGAARICDAKDNDCDGFQDFFTDVDGDGDGVPMCGGDCDDNNPLRSPNLIEGPWGDPTCSDFIDNDCDYKKDMADVGCGADCLDTDSDGYGNPGNPSCTNGGALDCDNFNALINPGATDTNCNGVDDNCSGTADDGYVVTGTNCGVGECASTGNLTCSGGVENNSCTPGTPVVEGPVGDATCSDTLDNDCDSTTDGSDTGCQFSCLDDDGDGYGLYGDASCTNAGVDCDDNNININPGATDDVCDGVDANCSGTADDEYVPTVTNCGVGECATTGLLICNAGVPENNCSALAPGVEGPFGDPTCGDTLDNDCDTEVDAADNDCNPLDIDNDSDGYCEGPTCSDGSTPGDCDDTNPDTYPGAARVCDARDNDCDGFQDYFTDKDTDGDGATLCVHYQTGLQDCDDNNPNRFPGNIEAFGDPSCDDGIDNDCNFKIDGKDMKCLDQCNDGDGDGYGNPGHTSCANAEQDCDNTNSLVNPGATDDTCDGVDNNCSGTADDEYVATPTNCGIGECATTGTLTCSGGVETDSCNPLAPSKEGALGHATCSDTLDNDCDGTTDGTDTGCQSSCLDDDGDGYGYYGDTSCANAGVDCDDDNAAINPGATDDVCDGVDANCSGTPDDEYIPTPTNCGVGECVTTGQLVCNGGIIENNCIPLPAGVEDYLTAGVCTDTLDNDCDGDTDTFDVGCNPPDIDNDGDGYCEGPTCSDASTPGDCDDTDDTVHPGGNTTVCDGKDTNCDGWDDFFSDVDNDGDGVPLCNGDCNDNDPDRYPGNQEGPFGDATCFDGIDNDCNNKTDEADSQCSEPTCTTLTNPRNGPHMFDLLDGGNNVLKTPCQWCHFTDYQGTTLDERVNCQRCHAPASDTSDPLNGILKEQVPGPVNGNPAPTAYPADPPYGFGTALNVKLHSSIVLGTKYGAWEMDCLTCHNPHLQEQDARYGSSYGKLIKVKICFDNTATGGGTFEEIIEFTAASGPGSFADGPPHNENICEMCHTSTNHHQNDGTAPGGQSHFDGERCTDCHTHDSGFKPGAAGQSHNTHLDSLKGPNLDCETGCHGSNSPPLLDDGLDLTNTAICNNCHSPAGTFDGVNNSLIGAKANWREGVYDGKELKAGKEQWCAGCHDEVPANSMMYGTGVDAVNVIGSYGTFGFYDSGHGTNVQIDCVYCHDASKEHLDNSSVSLDNVLYNAATNPTNYRFYDGKAMELPRVGGYDSNDFRLCYSCHDEVLISNMLNVSTNFRMEGSLVNLHTLHTGGYTIVSCIACHDPHGTARPKMTEPDRMGEFYFLRYDATADKYFELTDPLLWNDPAHNVGGVIVGDPACSNCHFEPNAAELAAGLGPVNSGDAGWYLRTYNDNNSYSVIFDVDNDSITDNLDNCIIIPNTDQADPDGDGIGFVCDACPNDPINDPDADGICADIDICPYDQYDDYDNDGVCGDIDNCAFDYNPLQSDIDFDGVGDTCDNCIDILNPDQSNFDQDMFGDACDATCSAPVQLDLKHTNASNTDWGEDVELGPGNSIYVAGTTGGSLDGPNQGSSDAVIIKYDSNLNTDWIRQFGSTASEFVEDVDVDDNGAVYIAGHTMGDIVKPNSSYDLFVAKYDATGTQQWIKQEGTTAWELAYGMAVDFDSNVYVTGYTQSSFAAPYQGNYDIYVIKFDADGNELWRRQLGTNAKDFTFGADVDAAGNFYAAGCSQGSLGDTNLGNADVVVIKYSPDGTLQWIKQHGTPFADCGQAIRVDDAGNSYISGYTEGDFASINNGARDIFTLKINTNGDIVWNRQYGTSETDSGRGITLDNAGNVYVTGIDVVLVSYDSDGNRLYATQFGNPLYYDAEGIAVDNSGNVYITGEYDYVYTGNSNIYLLKAGGQCQQP